MKQSISLVLLRCDRNVAASGDGVNLELFTGGGLNDLDGWRERVPLCTIDMDCPAGHYCSTQVLSSGGSYVPTPCPAGTYRPANSTSVGATGAGVCFGCPMGYSSVAGSAACDPPPSANPGNAQPGGGSDAGSSSSQTIHLGAEWAAIAIAIAVVAGGTAAATVLYCRRRRRHRRFGPATAAPSRSQRGSRRQRRFERYTDSREDGSGTPSDDVNVDVDLDTDTDGDTEDDRAALAPRYSDKPARAKAEAAPAVGGSTGPVSLGPECWRVFFRVLASLPGCASSGELLALLEQLERLESVPQSGLPRYEHLGVSSAAWWEGGGGSDSRGS